MKKERIYIFPLLFLMLFMQLYGKDSHKSDSLINILHEDRDPASVLKALKELAAMNRDKAVEVQYLTAMLDKASSVDSISMVYDALSNLSRYYYNIPDMDSLQLWAHYIDSLILKRKDNPDVYYDVHSFVSKQFLYQGDGELSVDEAVRMQNKAKASRQVYGQICSSETLGIIYQTSQQDSLAFSFFQEALRLLEESNGDLQYRVYVLSNMIRTALSSNRLEEAREALDKYEISLDLQDEINRKNQIVNRSNWHRWMSYAFNVDLFLKKGEMQKARQSLEQMVEYGSQIERAGKFNIAVLSYFNELAYFHCENGAYSLALAAVDSILSQHDDPNVIRQKIDILSHLGRHEEAVGLYKKYLQGVDERNDKAFIRQVEQLRTLHNVNDKDIQDKELQISHLKVRQNQRLFVISCCVLILLVILIIILLQFLRRSRRLKNELLDEKQLLIESQNDLFKAKVKAENASHMKSAFMANISHEIRTPLNAIVGFSSLVIDPDCDEDERRGYSSIIQNNSDLLLNLINDVLDLSHMESGNLVVSLKPCRLYSICKDAIDSVLHRVEQGVSLTLSMQDESFVLNTDPVRFQQMLLNLLTNAAKFTHQGKIDLAVYMDEEQRQVRVEVTDTGCGIPPDKQEKVFGRFEKLDDYVQGAGLGLAICKMIAEQLGGSVYIDSAYTDGARFVFIHPFDVPGINKV